MEKCKYTFFISLNNPSKISITKLGFFYYLATEYLIKKR